VIEVTEKEALAIQLLKEVRERAQKIFNDELSCYDEDRILGGDPAVYAAAAERVLRELKPEILKLLLDW
jgi:hypothetical protein